jgi:hypothetical protein
MAVTPAARAFSVLYDEALSAVGAPNVAEAKTVAKNGINNGIRRMNQRVWRSFGLKSEDITLVASTQEYALTDTSLKDPLHAELLNSSDAASGRLTYLAPKVFEQSFPYQDTEGWPRHYTIMNFVNDNKVRLSAKPQSSFVTTYPKVKLRFFGRLDVLSNDADLHGGNSDIEHFLVLNGELQLVRRYDPSRAGQVAQLVELEWRNLIKDDNSHGTRDWSSRWPG